MLKPRSFRRRGLNGWAGCGSGSDVKAAEVVASYGGDLGAEAAAVLQRRCELVLAFENLLGFPLGLDHDPHVTTVGDGDLDLVVTLFVGNEVGAVALVVDGGAGEVHHREVLVVVLVQEQDQQDHDTDAECGQDEPGSTLDAVVGHAHVILLRGDG